MAVKLLCLCLLLVLLCSSRAKKQQCLKTASSCDKCIQSGSNCAWCTAPHSNIRCHTSKRLQRAGCDISYVFDPKGGVQHVKNDSMTEPVSAKSLFLQPQGLSLRLRPGVSQSFPLTIIMPTDQPIRELPLDTSPVLVGVTVTFSYISSGNPSVVEVNVEATQCPSESDDSNQMHNRTGPWSVHITPRGFSQSVNLEINLACQCDCTRNRQENSSDCGGHGAVVCGQCECYEPYAGQRCQRNTDFFMSPNEDTCRSGPNATVCSGRGMCVEGFCECESRENPEEKYFGSYCQCNNFECPYWNRRICGGNGKCECGRCFCDDGWTNEDCSCTMEMTSCLAENQMVCNGRGTCECGTCKCLSPYAGPTCEHCPHCAGPCLEYKECAECRAFGEGVKTERCDRECSHLTVTMVETKYDLTDQLCRIRSRDDLCTIYYSISRSPSGARLTVAQAKECPLN